MNRKNDQDSTRRGPERKPASAGFYEVCAQWQNGKISAIEAARRLGIKLDQFYYFAKRDGLRKKIVSHAPRIAARERFPHVVEQWKRGDLKTEEAAQMLDINIMTFYEWTRAHGLTGEEVRKLRHEARAAQFEKIFVKWRAKELSTEEAATAFGVRVSRFRDWVKQRHPDALERKAPELPALFFQVYEQWKQGEIKAVEAARILGVPPAKFYAWTAAQGSIYNEQREQRAAQFEKIFVKWKAKKLSTEEAAKAFGVSKSRFREWVKRLHPEAVRRNAHFKHSGYAKFPFYCTAYLRKKITLKQAAAEIGVSKTTFNSWIRCYEAGGMKLDFAAAEKALGMNQEEFLSRISARNSGLRTPRGSGR